MFREGKNVDLLGEHQMEMTDEGIEDKTSKSETKLNWSGIEKLQENDQYFFLYNSSVSAYIFPKRDFQNVDEIRSYFKSKLED